MKQATKENFPLRQALIQSAETAKMGTEQATQFVAHKGNGGYLRERSGGHQDPGTTSMFLILKAATDTRTDC